MPAPLIPIGILSCYKDANGDLVLLPSRMAQCAPDLRASLIAITGDVSAEGGQLRLSDLFRSYDMQLQAHLDYKTGKKSAYSPPPGGSLHEGGRAFDVDVAALGITLARFWQICAVYGVVPIIAEPKSGLDECWHFEQRGSHALVLQYYQAGKAKNMQPYTAMAASSILALGVAVPRFSDSKAAAVQAALIRLGADPGPIDGQIGSRTRTALEAVGVQEGSDAAALEVLEGRLKDLFPAEYDLSGRSVVERGEQDDRVFWEADQPPARSVSGC